MQKRNVRFIEYADWYHREETELRPRVLKCLEQGELLLRGEVKDFETSLAAYVGTKHPVGCSNCTDALRLALVAAGICPGDEVITSAHTFAATVAAIVQTGAVPVLADIKPDDQLIDVASVKQQLTKRTRAIMPVSLNGRVADVEETEQLAKENGLLVIEDAAQGLGAYRNGRMSGSFGVAGCFSFYPAKTLGALGDAGAITTDSDDVADRLRRLRNHNRGDDGDIVNWGYNCRIDNVQAAVLNYRLSQIERYVERRREIAGEYRAGLQDVTQLSLPPSDRNEKANRDAFQNYECEADDRDGLVSHLRESGIEVILPWGGRAIHHLSAYSGPREHLGVTDLHFGRVVSLPMHSCMSDADVSYVIASVRQHFGYRQAA